MDKKEAMDDFILKMDREMCKKSFRYFFQHQIANKLKDEDPEALAAISLLVDDG